MNRRVLLDSAAATAKANKWVPILDISITDKDAAGAPQATDSPEIGDLVKTFVANDR
jgi:hypothetical protein